MPSSVVAAAVAGTLSGSTFTLAAIEIGFSWSAFVSSLVLSSLTRASQRKSQQAEISGGRLVNIRQPISSWQVIVGEARVGGTITFVEVVSRGGGTNNVLNLVITLAGHVCEEIGDIYFGDELVPLDGLGQAVGRYNGWCTIRKSLGDEDGQPFPALVASDSDGKWTDAHRQSGRTKTWLQLIASPDLWPNGIPIITAKVKGAQIYDPRTDTTAWSANAALWVAHYFAEPTYGLGAEYDEEIDTDDLNAAANICEEAVTLAAGGSEERYQANGAFLTSQQPEEVLGRLLSTMAGKAVDHGGKWHIYAGAYYAPTITLDEDDIAGPFRVQSLVSRRDSCNGVKGIFTDPDSSWQPTDFPAIASSAYMLQDNNERVWRDVDFSPFVTSGTQAQRLGKIELLKTRQALTAGGQHKLTAFGVVPGRTVALNNTKFAFVAKPFDVERCSFSIADGGALTIDLAFRETDPSIYDWDTSEEQSVDPAPNTTLPDPFTVVPPGTLTAVEELYQTTGSAGVRSRVTLTWTGLDGFAVDYSVEYKLSTDTDYIVMPTVQAETAFLFDLEPGIYNFRHRAIGPLGVRSDYSPVITKELFGLTAPPSNPSNFAVQAYAGMARCTWDRLTANSDLDVLIGGKAILRWSPKTSGASWQDGTKVHPDGWPGDATQADGPLQTGTFMLKFEDSSGNFSVTEASFVVTEALLSSLSTLATVTESTAFSGTKTNVAVADGALQLAGATLWDSMAGNIDDWGKVDYLGGINATGSYAFASKMDLGSVKSCRLFANITSAAYDTGDLWDSRTDNIDDWGLVDGAVIEDAEATLMVRATNDDPNGTPTWGAWHRLGLVADYNARGFDFRLDFTSGSVTHNRAVTTLSVTAKQ